MDEAVTTTEINFEEPQTLSALAGPGNIFLKNVEQLLEIQIGSRGTALPLFGASASVTLAARFFEQWGELLKEGVQLEGQDHVRAIHALRNDTALHLRDIYGESVLLNARGRPIKAKGLAQRHYLHAIRKHDLTFGIGPAGTGKTYLAMAMAVQALMAKSVRRIILTRPAVEAGERLGFLPGDLAEKVNPYLRPLYDALDDMMDADKVDGLIKRGNIEVAPLAFMRGRTLSNAFVILDESQNATPMQMKMFLTRMGENSRMVITGDPSQIDLPFGAKSGLKDALELLPKIRGVEIIRFGEEDVVRHDMVTRIVKAYNKRDAKLPQRTADKSARKRAPEPKNPSLLDDGVGTGQENEQK